MCWLSLTVGFNQVPTPRQDSYLRRTTRPKARKFWGTGMFSGYGNYNTSGNFRVLSLMQRHGEHPCWIQVSFS